MKDKHWAVETSEAFSLIAEQSALLTLRGIGINEQVKSLKRDYPAVEITRTKLVSLKKHPKYKEIYAEESIQKALNGSLELKACSADLVPDVIKCLRNKLQEGDVRAATIVFNILADKKDDEGPKQAQQLNITLATDVPPKIVS